MTHLMFDKWDRCIGMMHQQEWIHVLCIPNIYVTLQKQSFNYYLITILVEIKIDQYVN